MTCFHPLKAYRGRTVGASGKAPIVFGIEDSTGERLEIACGQCIGCRLDRAEQWAARCMHEASMHEDNCVITLTYSPECLPSDLSLNLRHWQLFAKRLRKRMHPFRFYQSGEYGEQLMRPHYHALLFGLDFPDKRFYKQAADGSPLYTSETLDKVWGLGQCTVGRLTYESACYVARYVMKKVTGDLADEHYSVVDDFGELRRLEPEFSTMSRRPGIGFSWFQKFGNEVYPSDEVIVNRFPKKVPRYYDGLLAKQEPDLYADVKSERVLEIEKHAADCTPARLKVREEVLRSKIASLKRVLVDDV